MMGLTNYARVQCIILHLFDSNDTDSDGFSDSFEVEIGTNPLVSDSQLVNYISKIQRSFHWWKKQSTMRQ